MKIFIDSEFKCHVANSDGNYREIETDFFDGKCDEYIEGYQFIPEGENWTHSNNTVFNGEMIAPWKDYSELIIAQYNYEKQKLDEYKESLKILGVEV